MAERGICGLCQSPESVLVHRGVRYDPVADVRRCRECGLVYLWPRASQKELESYYAGGYRDEYDDGSMQDRYVEDIQEARERVRRVLPLVGRDCRALEIGCGSGAFLEALRPYVASTTGVEPESASRKWLRQKKDACVVAALGDLTDQGPRFDLIVLFHVLEHVPNPVAFLREVSSLLAPSGRLVVEVPNVDDALLTAYEIPGYAAFYYQKAHLYYFSADTLRRTLLEAGVGCAIEGIQRYDIGNHMTWMLTGRPGGQGRYADLLGELTQAAYADALVRAGRSDTLWATGSQGDSSNSGVR